jgi:hypothetical protein
MRNNGLGGTPKAARVPRLSGFRDRVSGRTPPCALCNNWRGATTGGCVCAPNAARCPETRPALHDLRTRQARLDRGGGNCRHVALRTISQSYRVSRSAIQRHQASHIQRAKALPTAAKVPPPLGRTLAYDASGNIIIDGFGWVT